MIRRLRRLAALGLVLLLVTAAGVLAATLAMVARHEGGRSLAAPVDAAIVLGAGVDPDGILGWSSRRRVIAGVELLQAGLAARLIMSGRASPEIGTSAAELMRAHAVRLGAPAESVLVERESATTFENLRFSFRIARAAGLDRLALVTDDSHLLRAGLLACYFGECGIGLVAVPAMRQTAPPDIVRDLGRETLAWWYNFGKVALWSTLGAAGMPDERRARIVE